MLKTKIKLVVVINFFAEIFKKNPEDCHIQAATFIYS